ncbi:protease SohB [Cellvibrio zantedeschiae]|uniref:Protease SohB n=1 Tax=Cellvibrio zantedeschiae TaxID=1237077 RepID=A0ABQ3B2L3_9GAMM|nr:protease SohB [Cellvibrio zantedeschiae]GGY71448.1 protease SohB [Cellvibrio zantedeschiae]
MEFLTEYGLFLAKTLTFVVAVFVIISLIVSASSRAKKSEKGHIQISKLNEKFKAMREALQHAVLDEDQIKQLEKDEKKRLKLEKAEHKKAAKEKSKKNPTQEADAEHKKRVFVLDFHGDIKASANDSLREAISAVLTLATPKDEVVVKVESGGGMVHSYGLASSQLARITNKEIPLTVCVDKVAASGGYMMACVANKIVAAPFAILGSIGVVAQLPNFHRLLKKNDIDYEMFTAGEFKRTVTMFGENTEKGREKFVEDIEDTHVLFKDFVSEHRPQVDIATVATGEVWFGRRAKDVNLIDLLQTSDEYLLNQVETADIFEVEYTVKKSLTEKFGFAAQTAVERALFSVWEKAQLNRWF